MRPLSTCFSININNSIFINGTHIGDVQNFDGARIYTNEGNTSSAPGVVANGGAVRKKSYSINDPAIDGYVWIDCDSKNFCQLPELILCTPRLPLASWLSPAIYISCEFGVIVVSCILFKIMGGGFYNCQSVKNWSKKQGTWHTVPKLGGAWS